MDDKRPINVDHFVKCLLTVPKDFIHFDGENLTVDTLLEYGLTDMKLPAYESDLTWLLTPAAPLFDEESSESMAALLAVIKLRETWNCNWRFEGSETPQDVIKMMIDDVKQVARILQDFAANLNVLLPSKKDAEKDLQSARFRLNEAKSSIQRLENEVATRQCSIALADSFYAAPLEVIAKETENPTKKPSPPGTPCSEGEGRTGVDDRDELSPDA